MLPVGLFLGRMFSPLHCLRADTTARTIVSYSQATLSVPAIQRPSLAVEERMLDCLILAALS